MAVINGTPSAINARPLAGVGAAHFVGVDVNGDVVRVPTKTIYAAAYGVKADGSTDDTVALNKAFTAASLIFACVVLPPGTIIYNGTGWNSAAPQIVGDGTLSTIVVLGANSRLIDSSVGMGTLRLERVRTVGGKGAVRNTFTGTNVAGKFYVRDCEFKQYTSACIENNAVDQPCWTITGNQFIGANYTSSIGIALNGWGDSNIIMSNDFQVDRYHIKLGRAAMNTFVLSNDFLRTDLGGHTEAVDLWVVPAPASEFNTSGQGFICSGNKFGNEGLVDTDLRVIYADEGAGATFGVRMHATTQSTGYISGQTFRDNTLFSNDSGGGVWPGSFVKSYTPNVFGCEFAGIFAGTFPTYLLEYVYAPAIQAFDQNNIFGPVKATFTQFNAPSKMKFVSHPGTGRIVDPTGLSDMASHKNEMPYLNRSTARAGAGFINLIPGQFSTGGHSGTASVTTGVDGDGGNNSLLVSFTAGAGNLAVPFTNDPVVGVPVWIEFDIGPGAGTPIAQVKLAIAMASSPFTVVYQEYLAVDPASIYRVRRQWVPRNIPAGGFNLAIFNANDQAGTVNIDRGEVYQSREPVGGNILLGPTFMEESQAVPAAPASGGYFYIQGGKIKYRNGTLNTEIAGGGYYYYNNVVFDAAGTGSPEGAVVASIGSTWRRLDGGTSTSFYVKESGAGNTGWVAK